MNLLRPTSGRSLRRDYGIVGFVGPNGSGKSALAVWDTLPTLEAGNPVLSTVRLLDYTNPRPCELDTPELDEHGHQLPGEGTCPDYIGHALGHMHPHPLWVPFTRWEQLLTWEYGDVIMDEVSGVASSRESHAMPGEVGNHLQQLRRGDIVVRWTAPSWARADKVIRECSQIAVSCVGRLPRAYRNAPDEPPRRWKQRRLFSATAYDATLFEDFTVNSRDRLKSLGRDIHWGPGSPVFDAYDTYDAVLAIGSVNASGGCMTCGGSRPRPKCTCPESGRSTVGRPRSAPRRGAPPAGSAGDGATASAGGLPAPAGTSDDSGPDGGHH